MNSKDFWSFGETITGTTLLEWSNKDLVYGWFRGEECLYIGQTGNGIKRLLTHDVINVTEPVEQTDAIRMIEAVGLKDRLDLELTLIKRHHPLFNKRDNSTYYKTKKERIAKERPKLEDVFTTLPDLYKIKSIYIPSQ